MTTFAYILLVLVVFLGVGLVASLLYVLWQDFVYTFDDTMKDLNDDFTMY